MRINYLLNELLKKVDLAGLIIERESIKNLDKKEKNRL